MKKWMTYLLCLFASFLFSEHLPAQLVASNVFTINIQDVCLIRLNPATTINMSLLASVAGETMAPAANSSTYLQLTSIAPANQTRKIMAIISGGNVPDGTLIKLTSASCTSGAGTRGTPTSSITLDKTTNQILIDGIGSCYTGTSAGNGFNLTYTWQVDQANYALLKATGSTTMIIMFTVVSD